MSEVRLIDANALKLMKVAECAGHTIEYAAGWKRCVEYCKNDAPTVDAVPVEWIESYARNASATGDLEDEICSVAIEAMLNDWAKSADGEREPANGYGVMAARMLE